MERKYKDSGIEWIGKVPETWEVCRFKNLHEKANVGESIDKEFCTENSSDILFYTAGLKPIYTSYNDFPDWKYVDANDLLLARNGTPYVYLPLVGAVYSDHIIRTPIKKNVDKAYIRYCLQQAIASVVVDTVSIATWSVSVWDKQFLPFPPFHIQQRIADYLDKKCGEIDSLITLQEQMIEKLKAYKQSVITETVTKGLDPNAKLVPSGIDWIGNIPEGWEVCRFKSYIRLHNEKCSETAAFKVNLENIESKSGRFIPTDSKYEVEGTSFRKGDVLFGKLRPYLAKVFAPETEGSAIGDIYVFRPTTRIDTDFLKYTLLTDTFVNIVDSSTYGTKMPRANWEFISCVPIVIPLLSEQQTIALYLDEKCAGIDRLISLKQQKIESLKDYKKSVIYEAVTGKTIIE